MRPTASPSAIASSTPRLCEPCSRWGVAVELSPHLPLDCEDGPRGLATANGLDDDGELDIRPGIDEPGGFTVTFHKEHGRRNAVEQHLDDVKCGAVVSTEAVADPDDNRRAAHPRSTLRSRKWVAQEMQGS